MLGCSLEFGDLITEFDRELCTQVRRAALPEDERDDDEQYHDEQKPGRHEDGDVVENELVGVGHLMTLSEVRPFRTSIELRGKAVKLRILYQLILIKSIAYVIVAS